MLEGISTAQIVLFHQGSTELWRCENCFFVLYVNILTGVASWLLGPHNILPCVLIKTCLWNHLGEDNFSNLMKIAIESLESLQDD